MAKLSLSKALRMWDVNMAAKALTRAVILVTALFLHSSLGNLELTDLLTEEVSTAAGTPGELWVSRNSTYCNWKQSMGPICNYNETNQVVVVPAGLSLPSGQLEVEIHRAKTLHVYPTCISWIQVFSAGLVTTLPSEEGFYSMYQKRCRTWLRIYNSRADTISHGVKDLTIINTLVNTINLSQQRDFMAINSTIYAIEALSWEGYRGTVQNTTIERIRNLVAKDNWLVISSNFTYIAHDGIVFKAKEMTVTNSTIGYIASHGIKITSGAVSFSNVTIDILETSAIDVKSPDALLVLTNVTITTAYAGSIVLLDRERIVIKNVTVQGAPLDVTSPYLKFVEDFVPAENVTSLQVEIEREGCSSTETTLTCDFNSVNESIELNAGNIEGYQVVKIKNVKSLQVLSTSCNLELQLLSVNGTLPHFATETNLTSVASTKTDEHCDMSLSVSDSKLDVINSRYVSNMTVANSTVKRLHDGSLDAFNVQNVTIVTMDSVNITGKGSKWTGVLLGSVFNVTLQAPVKAKGVFITQRLRKGALTIDHPGETTEMSQVQFSTLERESLVVKRGKLILKNLIAIAISEGGIYVEEGASIELYNMMPLLTSYRTISVATKDQVFLNGTNLSGSGLMIHVRNPAPDPDMGSNLTISAVHLSPYCTSVPLFLKVCDFSHVSDAKVVVDLNDVQHSHRAVVRGASFVTLYPSCIEKAKVVVDLNDVQHSHRAVVRGASFVTLYPSCIEKLILLQVKNATTVDNENDCETWLEARGVHFINITSGVHDVTLTSCYVEFLSPNRKLRDLDLENTHVKWIAGVHWSGYTGLFNNSYLEKVEGLIASSRMVMSNTTVEKILPQGILVKAEGVIANSNITDVATEGIIVEEVLRMKDVTIGSLAKRAIVVKNGVLFLSNVDIGSSEEQSIVATAGGAVAMQNVTVAGKQVHWRGYIADTLGPNDPSLVFVNKYVEDDQQKMPTIPDLTPEEISKATPQSSSMTKSLLPDDNERNSAGTTDTMKSPDINTDSSSWKWAGVSVGIFMVVILGCCVVLTIKLVKPNNGRILPTVWWRIKDDQNDLLAEDQASSDFGEPPRQSGYHSVPGHDAI